MLRAARSFYAKARETEEHVTAVRTILLNGRKGSMAVTIEALEGAE